MERREGARALDRRPLAGVDLPAARTDLARAPTDKGAAPSGRSIRLTCAACASLAAVRIVGAPIFVPSGVTSR